MSNQPWRQSGISRILHGHCAFSGPTREGSQRKKMIKMRAFGSPESNYEFTGICSDYDFAKLRTKAITSVICWSVRPLMGFILTPPSVICFFNASSDLL